MQTTTVNRSAVNRRAVRRLVSLAVLLSLGAGACSSHGPLVAKGAPSGTPSGPGSRGHASPHGGPTASDSSGPRAKGAPPATPSPGASGLPSGPGKRNNFALTASLDKQCVSPGDTVTVRVVTVKGADVALAVGYSDNSLIPDYTYIDGAGNPTGTVTWSWVIRPAVPPGDALMSVVAKKDRKGASYNLPFRVSRSC